MIKSGIDKEQLLEYVIRPTLNEARWNSQEAEVLLLGTAQLESNGGHYIHQISGPALSIYQIEPATFNSLIKIQLSKAKIDKIRKIIEIDSGATLKPNRLITDLKFATLMCRAKYLTIREPLPHYKDYDALRRYYKLYYNTMHGKADLDHAIDTFEEIVRWYETVNKKL